MTVNENWKKQIRSAYEEITTLQKELNEIQEVADLYAKLFSSTKNDRKLKTCSMKEECVVKLIKKNIPSHFVTCCSICSQLVHQCCTNDDLSCPHCTAFKPTIESGKTRLVQEQNLIHEKIAEIIITIAEKELKFKYDAQKLEAGVLTKSLEKILEKYGGSRKAFFQAYSGAHLIKMSKNIEKIVEELPVEIKDDERVIVIFNAIKLFFEAKKTMKKELNMTDDDIFLMKSKVQEFSNYMKENLGSLKVKQKGHLFLFETPAFISKFRTASFFNDEAIEAYHPVGNDQEKRIKCKQSPKRYSFLLKCGIDQNFYYDTLDCKQHNDE